MAAGKYADSLVRLLKEMRYFIPYSDPRAIYKLLGTTGYDDEGFIWVKLSRGHETQNVPLASLLSCYCLANPPNFMINIGLPEFLKWI
jgi:hypothetical protein